MYATALFMFEERKSDTYIVLLTFNYFSSMLTTLFAAIYFVTAPYLGIFAEGVGEIVITMLVVFATLIFTKWVKKYHFWDNFPRKILAAIIVASVLGDTLNVITVYVMRQDVLNGNQLLAYISIAFPFLIILIFFLGLLISVLTKRRLADIHIEHQQREYYQQVVGNFHELSILRHDLKNHLETVHLLPSEEGKAYLREVRKNYDSLPRTEWCKDDIINAVMTNKNIAAKERGIFLDADILVNNVQNIAPIDLTAALANLLDNAIEASKIGDTVYVHIRYKADCLFIQITNLFRDHIAPELRRGSSKQKNGHGYGLISVKQIAKKYAGNFQLKTENQNVVASLVLTCNT